MTVDEVVAIAHTKALRIVRDSERQFVDSVTGRGALTTVEALKVLDEERPGVLDSVDEAMKEIRAWLLRGCKDSH
jgi:hypothetical protein